MKKLFLTMATAAMLFIGCSKEQIAEVRQQPESIVAKAIEFSDVKLQFASIEELDATIMKVAMMTPAEKQAWEASQEGFVSMNTASLEAGAQMREYVGKNEALTLREAYSKLFLFNPSQDKISLVPYFKSNRIGYASVCNAYGEVEVAGQTVNLNDITSYEQTWVAKAIEESASQTRQARNVNSIRLNTNAPYRHLIAASSCNIVGGRAQVFGRFSGLAMINDEWEVPSEVKYTVMYMQGITNNSVITSFDTRFDFYKLTAQGDSFTHVTTAPEHMVDEFIGWANSTYSTGYQISGGGTDKKILFFQNY